MSMPGFHPAIGSFFRPIRPKRSMSSRASWVGQFAATAHLFRLSNPLVIRTSRVFRDWPVV